MGHQLRLQWVPHQNLVTKWILQLGFKVKSNFSSTFYERFCEIGTVSTCFCSLFAGKVLDLRASFWLLTLRICLQTHVWGGWGYFDVLVGEADWEFSFICWFSHLSLSFPVCYSISRLIAARIYVLVKGNTWSTTITF